MEVDQPNIEDPMDTSDTPTKEPQTIGDTPFSEHATKLKALIQEKATTTNLFPVWKVFVRSFCDTVCSVDFYLNGS
mgnify:CR=1 FL=1